MSESFAKTTFPKLYSKIEKSRQNVLTRPLRMKDINTLLSIRISGKPLFEEIDNFYSDEYKKALEEKRSIAELEKIEKFRTATAQEANLLYNDLHVREEKEEYTGAGAQSE